MKTTLVLVTLFAALLSALLSVAAPIPHHARVARRELKRSRALASNVIVASRDVQDNNGSTESGDGGFHPVTRREDQNSEPRAH
ncbi:hypothetical protein H0H93_014371, partial [Arthromyces matolae]